MRIRILKNKPLNEEEVVVQQSVDVTTTPAITATTATTATTTTFTT